MKKVLHHEKAYFLDPSPGQSRAAPLDDSSGYIMLKEALYYKNGSLFQDLYKKVTNTRSTESKVLLLFHTIITNPLENPSMEILLRDGVDPNSKIAVSTNFVTYRRWAPLIHEVLNVYNNVEAILETFARYQCNLSEPDEQGYSLFSRAIQAGRFKLANQLLELGIETINYQAATYTSDIEIFPFMDATEESKQQRLEDLHNPKPILSLLFSHNNTYSNDRTEVLDQLIERKDLKLNEQDADGNTALHYAVINADIHAVSKLMIAGAESLQNNKGETPLDWANKKKLFKKANCIKGNCPPIAPTPTQPIMQEEGEEYIPDLSIPNTPYNTELDLPEQQYLNIAAEPNPTQQYSQNQRLSPEQKDPNDFVGQAAYATLSAIVSCYLCYNVCRGGVRNACSFTNKLCPTDKPEEMTR